MYLYVELWSPKQAWLDLTTSQRQQRIDQLLNEAKENPITGVIPVSVKQVGDTVLFDGVRETPAIISDLVARPTGYRYVAAWMVPDQKLITDFEQRVENLGWWFEYFDQLNAWGMMDVRVTVGEMVDPGPEALRRPVGLGKVAPPVPGKPVSPGPASTNPSAPPPSGSPVPGAPAVVGTAAEEFDYVIVGAGSAGSVLASRLSEDPAVSVLLLEAGGPRANPKLDAAALTGSAFDWKYLTEPEPPLDNRRLPWPRGKALGGSSAIAGKLYTRGHRRDFDGWSRLGCKGWSHDELLPYFIRSERNHHYRNALHGNDGPMDVVAAPLISPLRKAFLEAAAATGYRADPEWDFNGEKQGGVAGHYQYIERDGDRLSVAEAYLRPHLDRPNLTVRTHCLSKRIVFERTRAVGVDYVSTDWETRTARARREVVVSAGTIGSPQLLMLSGVGPAKDLRRHGIPIVTDLSGVGRNLQDHLQVSLAFRPGSGAGTLEHLRGTSGLFLHSRHGSKSDSPDLQMYAVEVVPEGAGPMFFVTACLGRPRSHGELTLDSRDPLAKPRIQAGYLKDPRDLDVLTEGFERIRRWAETPPLARLLEGELLPGSDARGTTGIHGAIRRLAGTNYHPVGTCKMGIDHGAVVDAELKVRGLKGLRVVDASIMPRIINCNTNAASIMIGEKAADLLKNSTS